MNTLEKIIAEDINTNGAMNVARFVEYALSHEEYGYYTKRDPFGREGDFITAPEISQCFGEMIAVYFINQWEKMGKPQFQLCEVGAGRGTLMLDLLNIAKKASPDFIKNAKITIVDTSPTLQSIQKEKLKNFDITWKTHSSFEKGLPLFFVANELLDALPVRQFQKQNNVWFERFVTLKDNAFAFELKESKDAPVPHNYAHNDFYEHNELSEQIVCDVDAFIKDNGGVAAFIDYGYAVQDGYKDTLQALSEHEFAHPFRDVGEQDITTHVNFSRLCDLLKNPNAVITQGLFLEALGIIARGQQLIDATNDAAKKEEIKTAIERLIAPQQMGNLFKVLLISNNNDYLAFS